MIKITKEDFLQAQNDAVSKIKAKEMFDRIMDGQEEAFQYILGCLAVLNPLWTEGFIIGLITIDNAQKRKEVEDLEDLLKKGGTFGSHGKSYKSN